MLPLLCSAGLDCCPQLSNSQHLVGGMLGTQQAPEPLRCPQASPFPLWALVSSSEPQQPPKVLSPPAQQGPIHSHRQPLPQMKSPWLLIRDNRQGDHRQSTPSNGTCDSERKLLVRKRDPGQFWANQREPAPSEGGGAQASTGRCGKAAAPPATANRCPRPLAGATALGALQIQLPSHMGPGRCLTPISEARQLKQPATQHSGVWTPTSGPPGPRPDSSAGLSAPEPASALACRRPQQVPGRPDISASTWRGPS